MKTKEYKIYISPANHYKKYAIEGYNEKQQMDLLAPKLVEALKKYEGVTPIPATVFALSREYHGRPEEAKKMGCDAYVALHTNTGNGKGTGACLFYHPKFALSKELALSIVAELNAICPIKSNRARQPAIYAWSYKSWNFGELREPANYGIVPVLIEHEFHDTVAGARWIIDNLDEIAEADARAIAASLGCKLKVTPGDVNGDGKVNSLDAAQILKHDAGIINLTDEQLAAGDVNGDGKVNSLDAAQILKHDAGL